MHEGKVAHADSSQRGLNFLTQSTHIITSSEIYPLYAISMILVRLISLTTFKRSTL